MFVPGVFISVLTFPGVIVHELAHQLFCRLYKVPVFEVVYFQAENPCGYVLHEAVDNKLQSLMISIGPFFINTIIGALIALPASLTIVTFGSFGVLDFVLMYLGISIAMHAFPSTGDANVIWENLKEEDTPPWIKILGYPIVGLIYFGSFASFFWLDAIYGVLIVLGLPNLLLWIWG